MGMLLFESAQRGKVAARKFVRIRIISALADVDARITQHRAAIIADTGKRIIQVSEVLCFDGIDGKVAAQRRTKIVPNNARVGR